MKSKNGLIKTVSSERTSFPAFLNEISITKYTVMHLVRERVFGS